jgi:hypothetical protein
LVEYNPKVFQVANRFAVEPLTLNNARYQVPQTAGLGVTLRPFDPATP